MQYEYLLVTIGLISIFGWVYCLLKFRALSQTCHFDTHTSNTKKILEHSKEIMSLKNEQQGILVFKQARKVV